MAFLLWKLKGRSIKTIHEHLQRTYKIRMKYNKMSSDWFSRCPAHFWGQRPTKENPKTTIIYHCSEIGYHFDHLYGADHNYLQNKIMITPDKDLPLLISDPTYKSHKNLIEDRFQGRIEMYPYRQDLIDEREWLDIRSDHLYTVMKGYEDLLIHYLKEKYSDQIHRKNYTGNWTYRHIMYTIQGHTYCFDSNFDILSEFDILRIVEDNPDE